MTFFPQLVKSATVTLASTLETATMMLVLTLATVKQASRGRIVKLVIIIFWNFTTAWKQSLGQGNIFSSVCQEFCSQGGVPGQAHPRAGTASLGRYTPQAGTPPGRYTPGQIHPQAGTSLGRYTPRQVPPLTGTPPWADTPPRQVHLPGQVHPPGQVLQAGTPPVGAPPPPRSSACWEIRATCRRYASYWNAFLFLKNVQAFQVHVRLFREA